MLNKEQHIHTLAILMSLSEDTKKQLKRLNAASLQELCESYLGNARDSANAIEAARAVANI